MKCSGINLTKEMQDLYTLKAIGTLYKQLKEDLNKWRDIQFMEQKTYYC